MAAVKAILIHGNGGCTAGDIWLPWLERELTALGLDVTNQTFPDNIKARAQVWLPHLEALGADENTILIGHSSGAVAAMRYAETHRLLGSILVGVCYTDLGDSFEAASGYYDAAVAVAAHPRPPAVDRDLQLHRRPAHSDRGAAIRGRATAMQLLRVHRPRPLCGPASVSGDRGPGAAKTLDLTTAVVPASRSAASRSTRR